jgi:hypothetical protein
MYGATRPECGESLATLVRVCVCVCVCAYGVGRVMLFVCVMMWCVMVCCSVRMSRISCVVGVAVVNVFCCCVLLE